ncbi:zinc-binding dehydrogenase [Candidatus Poribacteria bacterium]|jgi:L-iditol 2-dehydrogenase|nr:zinc-binding dehydrogenase [Candidatus Poribacteria bacterium]MBT5532664.1 zinc-binding dehydrogenase [Candidatus Poribacteria bacterium]MBT5709518.1 zinc-binding dehydrogenase [Candidatus Poribacteria bacterium]MBT7803931.1 zinc-binding dehydrogenase [Candidatus Poribacteria bacterium]
MRAVVFQQAGQPLTLEDRPTPVLDVGDVLLQVDLCGVCASDLMAIDGIVSDYSPPVVLGHEIAARVVESRDPSVAVGTVTSVNPMISCDACPACGRGEHKYCPKLYGIGHDIDGGFADLMVVPRPLVEQGGLLTVEGDVSPERLMFVEPLGCVINALYDTPVADTVAVLGAGPIGLLFAQLAAAEGARVVVVEPLAHRRAVAQDFGADLVVDATTDGMAALVDATGGGADTVIVATDHEAALSTAFDAVRRGGTINFFGLAPAGRTIAVELEQLHFQGHKLQASWAFSRDSLRAARDLIQEGRVDLSPMVTERYALDDANDAIAAATARRGIKAVVDPTLSAA